jgi:hypothetical protein
MEYDTWQAAYETNERVVVSGFAEIIGLEYP